MKVIVIRPNQQPSVETIDSSLEAMQQIVGGYIEMYMPWNDDAAIICNDEGKIRSFPPNRIIFDDDGEPVDVIAGTFFLCRAPADSEDFESLTERQINQYYNMFIL